MSTVQLSKFLSFVLRHQPQSIGIVLDDAGWTDVEALLQACAAHGQAFSREELAAVVRDNDKQRFALSGDGTRIRANQGHSVQVELKLEPAVPPQTLYHGTAQRFLDGIRAQGLLKGARHHVHLSADVQTAEKVGKRHGKPVVLPVHASQMAAAGHAFFRTENGVWLTEAVPVAFLELPPEPVKRSKEESPRNAKVKIAQETLAACEAGFYTRTPGGRVELQPALSTAVGATVMYELGTAFGPGRGEVPGVIEVTHESTLEALVRLSGASGHLACLNFASARNPGGGFLGGAQAQEESLARSSGLYPCQLTQPAHYERNRKQDSLLYLDLALWSPRVPFFRSDSGAWLPAPVLASVITCAAPNALALERGVSAQELQATLLRRARMVLEIARHHAVDTLVLGAWGAGVFRNDPVLVAQAFRGLLAGNFSGAFSRVVFAVPGNPETDANARAFVDAFRT